MGYISICLAAKGWRGSHLYVDRLRGSLVRITAWSSLFLRCCGWSQAALFPLRWTSCCFGWRALGRWKHLASLFLWPSLGSLAWAGSPRLALQAQIGHSAPLCTLVMKLCVCLGARRLERLICPPARFVSQLVLFLHTTHLKLIINCS